MIETTELLTSYVRGVRRLSGAEAVTLYLPAAVTGLTRPLLVHDGGADPPEELATVEQAAAFADEPVPAAEEFRTGTEAGCLLVPLDFEGGATEGAPRRRSTDAAGSTTTPPAWLGLRFPEPAAAEAPERFLSDRRIFETATEDAPRWWRWLFSLGGALASHASQIASVLRDPVTGLPDRTAFQAILDEEVDRARRDGAVLSLILINPDEFAIINERFGREAGDQVVREISHRLRSGLRSSDPLSRYGGVIFSAVLPGADAATSRSVGEKLLSALREASFLDGAVRLGFSIGIASCSIDELEAVPPIEIVRRADQALNAAKRLGGGCIVDWSERAGIEESGAFDRLSGIFTGNMAKDYRNMVLLWDVIDTIATNHDFEGLSREALDKLYSTFKPNRIGLFRAQDDGTLALVHGFTRTAGGGELQRRMETVEPALEETNLMRLAIAAGTPRELAPPDREELGWPAYAVPLRTSGSALGALLLADPHEGQSLDSADLVFLHALGRQLAVALDLARLAALNHERQEGEKRKLMAELNQLRQALQQSKLLYRSPEMDGIVATARRVAPTDATVLITGESGTGKELLARTVHELSDRRDRPFVVVDCGSIATTLIESELFGHEKGAYTGAEGRRSGRLAEADTGTVFLDEIGELPLEVQSKLLRFVQEKQFAPIGGGKNRRVDVRIVAATNRNLAAEVTAGHFREDLYYRLNVVRLEVPPLRERPDDVLHLAQHFLESFAVQYQKSVRRFSERAEQELTRYGWPGNVRELQNRIMQAVILCDRDELDADGLSLPLEPAAAEALPPSWPGGEAPAPAPAPAIAGPEISGDSWERLRVALGRELDVALAGERDFLHPLGTWIREDLILEADRLAGGVARQAAQSVGIPETTFRRRLAKAVRQRKAGLLARSGRWNEVQAVLAEVIRAGADGGADGGKDLVRRALRVLLGEILERLPDDVPTGSQLLGVTPPTFRARIRELV